MLLVDTNVLVDVLQDVYAEMSGVAGSQPQGADTSS